jgi:hypothetical protein
MGVIPGVALLTDIVLYIIWTTYLT